MSIDANVRLFHRELNALLDSLETKARSDNEMGLVQGVKNKLKIARIPGLEHVVLAGVDTFFQYNDDITNRNETLLLSGDTSTLLEKSETADDQKLYNELINLVRTVYKRSNKTDRAAAWDSLEKLRDSCFQYKRSLTKK